MRLNKLTGAVCAGALLVLAGSSLAAPQCPADVNGDGTVGISDFLLVLSDWGAGPESPCNINHDKVVDIRDVLELLAAWGPCT